MPDRNKPLLIAGASGMVGSACKRQAEKLGFSNIQSPGRTSLDLLDGGAVRSWFAENTPAYVIVAAAKVGGIHANNTMPAEFVQQNLLIECNLIDAAYRSGVEQLLFLGSSCIYPKMAPQPIPESALLQGGLEPTNEPYAIAKIAGIKLCESYRRQYGMDFRSLMPTNLYGPGDNYHPENSHVVPALIRRFHAAKIQKADYVEVWGSGTPKREFLFVDDLAEACFDVMDIASDTFWRERDVMNSHVNVGTGIDCTIRELSESIRDVVGFKGEIQWDSSKPDGTPRKLLDVSQINALGWRASTNLEAGLRASYSDFVSGLAAEASE